MPGFVAYQTLRYGGIEPSEIAVFDPDPDPVGAWRPRAAAIRQVRMRSESDGHCYRGLSRASRPERRFDAAS